MHANYNENDLFFFYVVEYPIWMLVIEICKLCLPLNAATWKSKLNPRFTDGDPNLIYSSNSNLIRYRIKFGLHLNKFFINPTNLESDGIYPNPILPTFNITIWDKINSFPNKTWTKILGYSRILYMKHKIENMKYFT